MRIAAFVFSLTLSGLLAGTATAGTACNLPATCGPTQIYGSPDCCARCGDGCHCRKYCKIICEMKEVKKVVWQVKCSEFCPLLPGCGRDCRCCGNCGTRCAEGQLCSDGCCKDCCDPCAVENRRAARMKTPKCGKVRIKRTLVKKVIICKVPTYKSVVVYCCSGCEVIQDCGQQPTAPPAANSAKSTASLPNPPLPPAPALPTR